MQILYLIYFFIIGTVFGSFYNVVGLRVPKKQMFQSERSYCPHCRHTLSWYELIPVFSYIIQRGKCRHCKAKISMIYPLVELFTGFFFAYSFYVFGFQFELITALFLTSLLAIIIVSDLKYMLIPNQVLLFFLPFLIVCRIFSPLDPWWSPIVGALIGYLLLALIIIVSRGGMGGGDMKLFGVLGIVLGYKGVLLAFFFSTLYGTVIGAILLSLKIVERKKPIPFGPFIVFGSLTAYFFGDALVHWYVSTFFYTLKNI
ncbi:prepilin peptidase [Aquibacillus koreensis]|uniref:Prepilin peptidase n=1 Tax=Aquibacillus koreensis TaxID=279446 RepID=A0A9X3WG54_9BACI|nr:A24 family peptidase [Aquibacillus koreensis]MCT2537947.1 prepilin peptidase [Aquibacillus koreensis]MDC3419162.1 prepilin peptidase [Aquibacillus koreensis]